MIFAKRFLPCVFILMTMHVYAADSSNIADDLNKYYQTMENVKDNNHPILEKQQAGNYAWNHLSSLSKERQGDAASVTLQGKQSACSNIDIINGSNKLLQDEKIKDGIKDILSDNKNIAYPFTLALETVSPMIAKNGLYWKDYVDQMNRVAINSCETAQSYNSWNKVRASQQSFCQEIVMTKFTNLTWLQARQICSGQKLPDGIDYYSQIQNDPTYKNLVITQGNVVWQALKQQPAFRGNNELAYLLMSLSGTITYKQEGNDTIKTAYPGLANQTNIMNALLNGGRAKIYKCDNDDACLNPALAEINIPTESAYKNKIAKMIEDIGKKVLNEESLTTEQQSFIASTSLPILQMMLVNNATPNASVNYLDLYTDLIATDMLFRYLEDALKTVDNSLMVTPVTEEDANTIRANIEKNLLTLRQRQVKITQNLELTLQVINQTQILEKILINNLSKDLAKSLSWAKGLK